MRIESNLCEIVVRCVKCKQRINIETAELEKCLSLKGETFSGFNFTESKRRVKLVKKNVDFLFTCAACGEPNTVPLVSETILYYGPESDDQGDDWPVCEMTEWRLFARGKRVNYGEMETTAQELELPTVKCIPNKPLSQLIDEAVDDAMRCIREGKV